LNIEVIDRITNIYCIVEFYIIYLDSNQITTMGQVKYFLRQFKIKILLNKLCKFQLKREYKRMLF
jgi:hypothetical protein